MITATLNGDDMPAIEQDFIATPVENAVDVQSLDGTLYTDFASEQREWTFSYESLTEVQYQAIRDKYDLQFTDYVYPTLSIPHYSLSNMPVRMYINEKNIWNNCGDVQGVQIKFRETVASTYVEPNYLLIDGGERLLINGNTYLIL